MANTLKDLAKRSSIKLLLIGDPTSGKTSSLATLVEHGYNVRMIDIDGGAKVLADLLDPKLWDKLIVVEAPVHDDNTYTRVKRLIFEDFEGLGPVQKWGLQDILVIDSFSFLVKTALRLILKMNGKSPDAAAFDKSLYGVLAKTVLQDIVAKLIGPTTPTNIIFTAH